MKKICLFTTALLITLFTALAANAQVGLGLRLTPDGGGFTGKFFVDRHVAVEAQLNAGGVLGWEDGTSFNAVGLVEYHIYLPHPGWSIFFGGGAHAGVWNHDGRIYNYETARYDRNDEGIFGIDAIGGVEYRFRRVPIGLSADIKPAINLLTDVNFFPHNMFGFSARFYL
ncbi:MAG: hypothetical protein JSS82_04295 [Bacteroidetes bacterium]|nr:hypothetical protein [Bacteroidota bacterium]